MHHRITTARCIDPGLVDQRTRKKVVQINMGFSFLSPPPEGGLDLVTNRKGAI